MAQLPPCIGFLHPHTCAAVFRSSTRALETIWAQWESLRPPLWPLRFHLSTHYPLDLITWNETRRERERAGSEGFSLHTITRAVASNYPKRRPQGTHPSLQSVRASNRCRELARVVSKLERTSVPKQLHQGVHCRLVSWLFYSPNCFQTYSYLFGVIFIFLSYSFNS